MDLVNLITHLGVWIFPEHPKDGYLCCHSLARACGRPQQHITVCVKQGVEDLSLNGVEVGELVQRFQPRIIQRCHWQRLKVQQLCMRQDTYI